MKNNGNNWGTVNIGSMEVGGGNCDAYVKDCHVEDLLHVAPRCKLGIGAKRLRKTDVSLRPYFNVKKSFLTSREVP